MITGEHLHEEYKLTEQIASNERDRTSRHFFKKNNNADVSGIGVHFFPWNSRGWVMYQKMAVMTMWLKLCPSVLVYDVYLYIYKDRALIIGLWPISWLFWSLQITFCIWFVIFQISVNLFGQKKWAHLNVYTITIFNSSHISDLLSVLFILWILKT